MKQHQLYAQDTKKNKNKNTPESAPSLPSVIPSMKSLLN